MGFFTGKIISRETIAEDTLQVSVSRPSSFRFRAGQYLQLGLGRLPHRDHRGGSRVFSIASSPNDEEKITVAFRRSASGFKRSLEAAPIGSEVMIAGPYGFLTLSEEPRRPLVLLASGIGITPHLSMIRFAAEKGFITPLTLLYVNRTRQRAAYLDELEQLAARSPSFVLRSRLGTLSEREVGRALSDSPNAVWHLTGTPASVERAREALIRVGVNEEQVCAEQFLGY